MSTASTGSKCISIYLAALSLTFFESDLDSRGQGTAVKHIFHPGCSSQVFALGKRGVQQGYFPRRLYPSAETLRIARACKANATCKSVLSCNELHHQRQPSLLLGRRRPGVPLQKALNSTQEPKNSNPAKSKATEAAPESGEPFSHAETRLVA